MLIMRHTKNEHKAVVKLLLKKGVEPDIEAKEYGETPLL
jgi:hypothetical protein